MHDADTAFAVVQAFRQEGREQVPGFVTVQTVKVDFVLRYPAPASQVAQDILGQPAT